MSPSVSPRRACLPGSFKCDRDISRNKVRQVCGHNQIENGAPADVPHWE